MSSYSVYPPFDSSNDDSQGHSSSNISSEGVLEEASEEFSQSNSDFTFSASMGAPNTDVEMASSDNSSATHSLPPCVVDRKKSSFEAFIELVTAIDGKGVSCSY